MPRPYRPATLAALLLIAFAAGPAGAFDFHGHGHGREGSGDLETRSLALDDFDEIIICAANDPPRSANRYAPITLPRMLLVTLACIHASITV